MDGAVKPVESQSWGFVGFQAWQGRGRSWAGRNRVAAAACRAARGPSVGTGPRKRRNRRRWRPCAGTTRQRTAIAHGRSKTTCTSLPNSYPTLTGAGLARCGGAKAWRGRFRGVHWHQVRLDQKRRCSLPGRWPKPGLRPFAAARSLRSVARTPRHRRRNGCRRSASRNRSHADLSPRASVADGRVGEGTSAWAQPQPVHLSGNRLRQRIPLPVLLPFIRGSH